jgi:hypothetical protein
MAVTDEIVETYLRPRAVIRRKLAAGPREDRALATLLGACALVFVAQWPALARAAQTDPTQPLDARMAGALLGSVFLVPLFAYAVAGISHLIARRFGGKGTYFAARMALFWAMLSIAPVMLLHGLARGFLSPGTLSAAIGVLVLSVFLYLWGTMLIEVERDDAG